MKKNDPFIPLGKNLRIKWCMITFVKTIMNYRGKEAECYEKTDK